MRYKAGLLRFSPPCSWTLCEMLEKPDPDRIFGALFVSAVISAMLFSGTCIQAFYYFQHYRSDKLLTKLFVAMLLVLETLQTIFNTYNVYRFTITSYTGDPFTLLNTDWAVSAEVSQSSIAIFAVHMFYTRRVYYVSHKNVPLVTALFTLVLAHFGMHIATAVKAFQILDSKSAMHLIPYLEATISLAVATDIMIAVSLSFYLHKSRSGAQNTDAMINRLIVHAINNGILTGVFDVLVLTIAAAYPKNMVYIAIYQVISKLYTNSVLATLNSRRSMTHTSEVTRISFGPPSRGSSYMMTAMGRPESGIGKVKKPSPLLSRVITMVLDSLLLSGLV
ncbi:hypothetical protein BDZ94DRAFT_859739 [Collybia nuda]|uniref:DUF6534 domain-containing protein n=1 Tax=Collybia nuda TaxID=64659 RepID=A0A9P6CGC6_9AGAR|nr:hypothetical protein BDZ94DRAFT_859739 [Collybia nuda]